MHLTLDIFKRLALLSVYTCILKEGGKKEYCYNLVKKRKENSVITSSLQQILFISIF